MIALRDELTALIAVAKNDLGDLWPDLLGFIRDHGPALLAALDDAERYRCVRDLARIRSSSGGYDHWTLDIPDPGIELDTYAVFDAAIDAAIDAARKP